MNKLDRLDPDFRKDLEESERVVLAVIERLHRRGECVTIPPTWVRELVEDIEHTQDIGDLYVNRVIDVKHNKKQAFTGRADYPYRQMIVCTQEQWRRANPKPWIILVLNAPMTHAAIIARSTASQWVKSVIFDKKRPRNVYKVPIDLVRFVTVAEIFEISEKETPPK